MPQYRSNSKRSPPRRRKPLRYKQSKTPIRKPKEYTFRYQKRSDNERASSPWQIRYNYLLLDVPYCTQ